VEYILSILPVTLPQFALICVAMSAAYIIFGIAGFGTALVAGPMLANFIPVAMIVPMLALLDFTAAVVNVMRDAGSAETIEVRRLVPMMIAGSVVGAALLLLGRPGATMLAMGVFTVVYSLYTMSGFKPMARFTPRAALPIGFVGGICSALFGSGGFIYSIYLAGRLDTKDQIRVTLSTLIGLSTLTRVILFLAAGVYADTAILAMAALLFPTVLVGTAVGRHITLKLSREQFVKLVSVIVLCSGTFLIYRYFRS
jgi:uncharacterized membrane protein YfcA